jgi:hypothetical protein
MDYLKVGAHESNRLAWSFMATAPLRKPRTSVGVGGFKGAIAAPGDSGKGGGCGVIEERTDSSDSLGTGSKNAIKVPVPAGRQCHRVRMLAVGGAGAAVGGAGGLATGSTVGAVCGLIPAVFTFGLSIPVGMAIGGGAGLWAGTVSGGAAGLVGGAAYNGIVGFRGTNAGGAGAGEMQQPSASSKEEESL